MDAKERIMAIRLLEKAAKHSEYIRHLGVEVSLTKDGGEQNKGQGT